MLKIVDFIDARLPGFRSAVRGASPEAIAALQARTSAPLPGLYRDFLTVMGESSSVFPAFPGYIWNVAALLDCWPGDDSVAYDRNRYFKIALNASQEAVSHEDYFLDLARSDGDDAPIVCFEDPSEDGVPGDWHGLVLGDWVETNLSLRGWLCAQAFHFFELMRRAELADCGVDTDEDAPEASWASACEVLDRLKLDRPLQAPHSWFGVGAHVSVYGVLQGDSVSVCVGADSRRELRRVVEVLRDTLEILDVGDIPRQESPTSL